MEDQETDRVGKFAAKLTGQGETSPAEESADNFSVLGWLMAGVGILVAGYALLGYDVTAPYSDTVNLGLLNEQLILAISGWALFVAGIVSIAAAGIIRRL